MGKVRTATIEEDSDGNLFIRITEEELNQMGWDLGDELYWEIINDGKEASATATKKKD